MATPAEPTTPTTEPSATVKKEKKSAFKGMKKNLARKLGRSNIQDDGSIVIAGIQYLDSLVETIPKLVKNFKRESEIWKELTDHQKSLLNQTTDFHQRLLQGKTENDAISPAFVENVQLSFCQLHTELFSLETNLTESISETSTPMSQIAGVAAVKEQYKKWEAAKQAFDAVSKKLENAKADKNVKADKNAKEAKIKELETEWNNAKTVFETADRDTLTALEAAIERIELEYLTRVKSVYVDGYYKFFQEGQKLLKRVANQISETPTPDIPTAGENTAPRSIQKKKGKFNPKLTAGAIIALAAVALAGYFMRK